MTMKTNYDVGYRKPPKHAQWKKGQSGNPAGRPRRDRDVSTLVAALLGQRVVVRKGKTTKRVTRLEHLLTRLIEKAIGGDPRLMKMALDEMRKEDARAQDETPDTLGPADIEVIAALKARLLGEAADGTTRE